MPFNLSSKKVKLKDWRLWNASSTIFGITCAKFVQVNMFLQWLELLLVSITLYFTLTSRECHVFWILQILKGEGIGFTIFLQRHHMTSINTYLHAHGIANYCCYHLTGAITNLFEDESVYYFIYYYECFCLIILIPYIISNIAVPCPIIIKVIFIEYTTIV